MTNRVSIINPKSQKVKTIKIGVHWLFIIMTLLIYWPIFVIAFEGYGLLFVILFLWFGIKANRIQIKQLLKRGWVPTTNVDKLLLVREGLLE